MSARSFYFFLKMFKPISDSEIDINSDDDDDSSDDDGRLKIVNPSDIAVIYKHKITQEEKAEERI